jgi:hypothetical protein
MRAQRVGRSTEDTRLLDLGEHDASTFDADVEEITDPDLENASQLGRDDDPPQRVDATCHTDGAHQQTPHIAGDASIGGAPIERGA